METCGTAMKVVRTVVDCEMILLAIECELTLTNAVAIATYKRREEGFGRRDAIFNIIMSLNNIRINAILIRHHDCHERTTIVRYRNFHTISIGKHEEVNFLTINDFLKVFLFKSAKRLLIRFQGKYDFSKLKIVI